MRNEVVHRPFFAIKPSRDAEDAIDAMRRSHCPLGHPVRTEHAHVTLEIFDDHSFRPDALFAKLIAIGDAIDVPMFRLSLDRIAGTIRSVALRPGRRSAGLARLQSAIHAGVTTAGLRVRNGWSFSPHLTLGYRDGASFSRSIPAIAWDVEELVLIHSFVGQTRHEIIGRWPLAPELPLFQ